LYHRSTVLPAPSFEQDADVGQPIGDRGSSLPAAIRPANDFLMDFWSSVILSGSLDSVGEFGSGVSKKELGLFR
jgi:hypothetical protein